MATGAFTTMQSSLARAISAPVRRLKTSSSSASLNRLASLASLCADWLCFPSPAYPFRDKAESISPDGLVSLPFFLRRVDDSRIHAYFILFGVAAPRVHVEAASRQDLLHIDPSHCERRSVFQDCGFI